MVKRNLFNYKNIKTAFLLFTAAVLLPISSGCSDGKVEGTLVINFISEHNSFEGLWLTCSEIAVCRDNDCFILNEQNKQFNLVDSDNSTYKLLISSELEAGVYSTIRLRFAKGEDKNFVLDEGQKYNLLMPEALNEEIILPFDFEIVPHQSTVVFLDFNIKGSLTKTDEESFLFEPAVTILTDLHAGSIKGTIEALATEATIYVYPQSGYIPDNPAKNLLKSQDVKLTTFGPDFSLGDFLISDIPEGVYELVIVSEGYIVDIVSTGIRITPLGLTDVGKIKLIPLS